MRCEIKTVYVARDGKEFPDKASCLSYERALIEKSLKMWDCRLEKTDNIGACQYVRLDTEEDVLAMMFVCEQYGIKTDGIKNPGGYVYLTLHGCWLNLNELIAFFNLADYLHKQEEKK